MVMVKFTISGPKFVLKTVRSAEGVNALLYLRSVKKQNDCSIYWCVNTPAGAAL